MGSNFSLFQAKGLIAESDQEFEGGISGISAESPSGQNAIFLGLLSSLVKKIDQLDTGMKEREAENTTIFHELKKTREQGLRGVLHPPRDTEAN